MTRLQWTILPASLIFLVVAIAYMGYLWTRPDGDTIHGLVNVHAAPDPTRPYTSGGCAAGDVGPGEYADLQRGAVVKVTDETGAVLSMSPLSRGSDTLDLCTFAFATGPLDESQAYTIQVGDRPLATFTREELIAQQWRPSLNLSSQTPQ
jgi:hypothetical protein